MVDRWAVERAVRQSRLDPPGRLLMLTLLSWADHDTAAIPDRFTPSLTALQRATGLARSTVTAWLNRLEADGWVVRTRPPPAAARSRKARTTYALTVPAGPADGPAVSDVDRFAGLPAGPAAGGQHDRAGPLSGPNRDRQPGLPAARASPDAGGHRYVEGPNGYCAVDGCGRSAPLHGRAPPTAPSQRRPA